MIQSRLLNDVAIITGAASGIGRETAITIAKNGAVAICLDVNEEGLKETVSSIHQMGNQSEYYVVSISDEKKLNEVMKKVFEKHGKISILVNCAAIILYNDIENCTKKQWNDIFEVNSLGFFLCLKSVAPYIKKNGGKIVQVSSSAALSGSVFASPAYVASKASTIGLSKHIASHWSKYNVRCNTICPGLTETPMIQDSQGTYRRGKKNIEGVPLGRNGQPDDIASVVLFLVSEDSKYITGQTIHVNGGKYMYNT